MQLPPLPTLNDKLHMVMQGPTPSSNWVIPGVMLAGAYPGALDDRQNDRNLRSIISRGVDTFVCLQAELDTDTPEGEWRAGRALRPYFASAQRLSKKTVFWRHLPIDDGEAAPDDDILEDLVCVLLDDVKAGRVLYVHCWGGHGRTGIVAALTLAVLYSLPLSETFKRIQAYHDCRVDPQDMKSPSTVVQRTQVKRLLHKWLLQSEESTANVAEPSLEKSANFEPPEPQLVIGKNGQRGFIVPPVPDKSKPIPSLDRVGPKAFKQQPQCVQQCSDRRGQQPGPGLRRSSSVVRSDSRTLPPVSSCRAVGSGAAASQMIRKSPSKAALA